MFGTLGTPESAGTIEEDEEYVSFVKALEREREEGDDGAGDAEDGIDDDDEDEEIDGALGIHLEETRAGPARDDGRWEEKIEREKEIEIIEIQKGGKSTTRLDDEPVAADAAPKRKQKPKAKSKKKSTSSTPTTTPATTTTATTTTKVLKRPSSIPTPRA